MQSGLRGVLNYPALPNPPHPIPTPCCKTDYLIDIIFFNFLLIYIVIGDCDLPTLLETHGKRYFLFR